MSCGPGGERQRPFWCQVESYVVSKSYCYPVRPPVHREACRPGECPQWHVSQWGQVYHLSAQHIAEPSRLNGPVYFFFSSLLFSTIILDNNHATVNYAVAFIFPLLVSLFQLP